MDIVLRFVEQGSGAGVSRTTSCEQYANVISEAMQQRVTAHDVLVAAKVLGLRHERRPDGQFVLPFELRSDDLGFLRAPKRLRTLPRGDRVFLQAVTHPNGVGADDFEIRLLDGNATVGSLRVTDVDDFSPAYLTIHPEHRRKGLGAEVVRLLEQIMRGRTMKIFALASAYSFWWHVGFCRDARTGKLLPGVPTEPGGAYLAKRCCVQRVS